MRFEIKIYTVIKQNFLNLAPKLKFMQTSTSQRKAIRFLVYGDEAGHSNQALDANMEVSHLRGLPFDHGIKSALKKGS